LCISWAAALSAAYDLSLSALARAVLGQMFLPRFPIIFRPPAGNSGMIVVGNIRF
jgi:hypothetical protein